MPRRYSLVCDDEVGERVADLAREYELTEEAVLRQLIERGLEQA
ncbi:MAG: putative DNA-binding protein, partial [Halobacteriales archaeon]